MYALNVTLVAIMGVDPQKKIEGTPLPSLFPFPPLLLEVGPLKSSKGVWESDVSSPVGFGADPNRN